MTDFYFCIGMAYGFSVFWLPLSRALGLTQPIACGADMDFFAKVFSTTCDWQISMMGWMFSLFFVFLGLTAALFGGWLEHAVLAGLIVAGLISNALVRPINAKYFMNDAELATERQLARERSTAAVQDGGGHGGSAVASNPALVASAWMAVGIPLALGIWITLQKAVVLFK